MIRIQQASHMVLASILVVTAIGSASSTAFATDAPQICETHINHPSDRSTAVSPDIVIDGTSNCIPFAPKFVDDTGANVPASFVFTAGQFTLTPMAPLAADRAFVVQFDEKPHCTQPPNEVTFSTKANPSLRLIEIVTAEDELHALTVRLSEPVQNKADLANPSFVSVTIDEFSAKGTASAEENANIFVTYKPLSKRPGVDQKVRVHIAKELAFASGAVLAHDIDATFVPAEWPVGYFPTGTPAACDFSDGIGGCQASPARVRGPLPWLFGVTVGLAFAARRRRNTRADGLLQR